MKKLILAAAALLVSIAAYGQGQVVINNRLTPDVNARLILPSDPSAGTSSSVGTDYTVNFFGGATGSAATAATALNPASSTLRGAAGTAAAGYFTGVTATVPGVDVGGKADIWLQVVNAAGQKSDFLGPFTATLGGGTVVPPNLAMGTSPITVTGLVPEPSTMVLGALGIGALLAVRRRK